MSELPASPCRRIHSGQIWWCPLRPLGPSGLSGLYRPGTAGANLLSAAEFRRAVISNFASLCSGSHKRSPYPLGETPSSISHHRYCPRGSASICVPPLLRTIPRRPVPVNASPLSEQDALKPASGTIHLAVACAVLSAWCTLPCHPPVNSLSGIRTPLSA